MIRALAALLGAAFLLGGCFAPDAFDARLSIRPDGRVQLIYTGRLTHLPSALEATAGRSVAGAMAPLTAQMRRDPKIRAVEPLGDGAFQVEYVTTIRLGVGEALVFPPAGEPWLTVRRVSETDMRIAARSFTADEARALRTLGVGLVGSLTLDTNADIARHNGEADGPGVVWRLAGPETPAPSAALSF